MVGGPEPLQIVIAGDQSRIKIRIGDGQIRAGGIDVHWLQRATIGGKHDSQRSLPASARGKHQKRPGIILQGIVNTRVYKTLGHEAFALGFADAKWIALGEADPPEPLLQIGVSLLWGRRDHGLSTCLPLSLAQIAA